ncbi:MAG: RluA family pseudouridine synthase [Bacillota bacterium]|jgi:23S rRNA pseudouridine1911/1915/1917 synthase|nr:RluA family pseudouridine synthase [Bacillota bacterium]
MTGKKGECCQFTVTEEPGSRLDLWLSERLDLTRSQLKRLIDGHRIKVNGEAVKAGYQVKQGDQITVQFPEIRNPSLSPEPIPLEIVYEDEALVVINKPKGLVVHVGAGHFRGTLVNALLAQVDQLAEGAGKYRPGIVHRLDKDTSGLMLVAKTNESYAYLTKQLQDRLVKRVYVALVQGVLADSEGTIDRPMGRHPKDRKKMAVVPTGRQAQTHFSVQERFRRHSLLKCSLVTGRTHQIRVHLASIHHPIVGDPLYGRKRDNLGAETQMLHAYYLGLRHPSGRFLEFEARPDQEFLQIVEKARKIG